MEEMLSASVASVAVVRDGNSARIFAALEVKKSANLLLMSVALLCIGKTVDLSFFISCLVTLKSFF